ncbi:MAG TPA: UDP-N-acetylmuramoyl-tripeptide--D-alanyl-D-alanine ligase [Cytophagaceae bacterium]|jgi:UDP-N-acetylmuramoyl-tripeptide--D-alanyl-D-alanine ligase|nr:UDP-N-acetylmuramoyl-tripeptide--D-alanyl-D-alanine ligase [Cytophagaceae bacterium]
MEIKDLYKIFLKCSGVSTDTRQITKDILFFALKGANFNGNEFAAQAIEAGASYAVVDEEKFVVNEKYLLVKDVLTTLQLLAKYHRRQFNIPFIAITGSNGKTTTKELVYAVLSTTYKTKATKGNLNNHIGIPLTLLSIGKGTEMAVIEMGANHQKEIEGYCQYVEPTHALITNIGKAHLEGFGGMEGVKKGKGELYDYMKATKGIVFVNSADSSLMEIVKIPNPILYPQREDFYHCELIESTPFVKYKSENGEIIGTQLTGNYNFDNIAGALCIGKYFKVLESIANSAVANYTPQNNRSQFIKSGSNEILLDAYNANPSSMKAAIENFNRLNRKNKVIILGDMFELGAESDYEHEVLGRLLSGCHFDKIILCGKNMKKAADQLSSAFYFATKPDLVAFIQQYKIENASIFIKGSRGIGLETILDFLKGD